MARRSGRRTGEQKTRELLERKLALTLLHPTRRFDRQKAFDRALTEIKNADAGYRRAAEILLTKSYGLRQVRTPLRDSDTKTFWKWVERTTTPILAACE